jgi:hypothetical protein
MTRKGNGAVGPAKDLHDAAEDRKHNTAQGRTPIVVTDHTAVTVLGLPHPRAFLPFLAQLGVSSVKIGRRRYARLDSILAAIDERTAARPQSSWSEADMLARAIGGRQ